MVCVGFLQSRDHDLAHGRAVTFAADVVCSWCEGSRLSSMIPSQRSKLYVSGPPAVLQMPPATRDGSNSETGLVCENLHSVRLNIAGDFKTDFMGVFEDFCAELEGQGRAVTLRPHPGGQYVLKNRVTLPPNVILNNNPIYKVDLSQFAYGISAPSSILIDMVLAGIPVAVWRDESGIMDADNYEGLTVIRTLSDWLDFSREAVTHPGRFLERQQRFLEKQKMPIDPADVHGRFARLFNAVARISTPAQAEMPEMERVLFIANGYVPTLQLSFIKPLSPMVNTGEIAVNIMTEQHMQEKYGKRMRDSSVHQWLDKYFSMFRPTILVFCRYSGPHAEHMAGWAQREGIPVIYHIDDDLLNIPIDIGREKYKAHNHPLRLATVRFLLDNADLVYCSTARLQERFENLRVVSPMVAGTVYCSGSVLVPAANRPVRKFGYMASADHAHNLDLVLPAIIQFLRRNPDIGFELFGSIRKPPALDEFGNRITMAPPIRNYENFLNEFAKYKWDIGICPLTHIEFNLMKANTKWVEYTSVGAAVVASKGTVYDDCCTDGCGLLAETPEEWLAALEKLTRDPGERFAQVRRAQKRLVEEYSTEHLRGQVLDIFQQARCLTKGFKKVT